MTRLLIVFLLGLAVPFAPARASEVAAAKPAAEQPAAKAEAANAAANTDEKEFKPPPGFYTKKRGALKVYCKKDRETGSRFVTEKCMTEDQVHEYLLALEIQKRDVDRIRATCGTGATCSSQ